MTMRPMMPEDPGVDGGVGDTGAALREVDRYWRRSGVPRQERRDRSDELRIHLVEAAGNGQQAVDEDVAQRLLHSFADRIAAHSRGEGLDGTNSTGGTLDVFSLVPPRALIPVGVAVVAFAAGVLVGRALPGRRG